jgi:hypothetical protein
MNTLVNNLKVSNHDFSNIKQTYLAKTSGWFVSQKYQMVLQEVTLSMQMAVQVGVCWPFYMTG